jgi:hypothetical protein
MGGAHGVVAFSSQLGLRAAWRPGVCVSEWTPHLCESVVESSGLVVDRRIARIKIAAEVR